ncbi:MAG: GntR family transcriptional regulator [Eubacteriales bacterium]|jgi:DNA-binding GntR family transcriptional regulator
MPLPSMPFDRETPPSKAEILEILTRWIIEMQLEPEEKISDVEIASYFRVSRTPIREALQILEGKKLVHAYPGRATVVAELGVEHPEQWYLPMQTLQCLAVRLAVEKATASQVDYLEQLNQAFGEEVARSDDVLLLLKLDQQFHHGLLEVAGNEYIADFCNTLWAHIGRLEYLFFEGNRHLGASVEDHAHVVEGMRRKDPFHAELAMKNNWSTSMLAVKSQIYMANAKRWEIF